jgi:acylphosphatase
MTATNPNEIVRAHIWVEGRVQGVGFRAFVLQAASLNGVTGWVRNQGYDQVETVAEGKREAVERFVEMIKAGPRAARVDNTRMEWEAPQGDLHEFRVRF